MGWLDRFKAHTAYGIGLLICAAAAVYLGIRPGLSRIDVHVGAAAIQFAADRSWIASPDECVQVTWSVSGSRAVLLNDQAVADDGQAQQCRVLTNDSRLTVQFADGSSKTYRLKIDLNPLVKTQSLFYLGAALASLVAGLWLLPIRGVALTAPIIRGANRAAAFFASELGLNLILLFGVVARLSQYLYNRAIYMDEATLIMNILNRFYGQLWMPDLSQDVPQAAPIGFLVLEKLVSDLFGIGQLAFRLVPLIASVVSLFLFKYISQRILDKKWVPLALLFFAGAERLLYYSAEVKQYSTDVCIALLIIVLGLQMLSKAPSPSRLMLWGFGGGVVIWFSHPAIFVLAALAFTLLYARWRSQSHIPYALVGVFCVWGVSFITNYYFTLETISETTYFNSFWESAFAPFMVQSAPTWFYSHMMNALQQAVFITPLLSAAAFMVGLVILLRTRPVHFLLIVMPIAVVLAAAMVRRYAFSDRLILFTIPFFIWGVVVGLPALFRYLPTLPRIAAYGLVMLPIIAVNFQIPSQNPDERRTVAFMKAHEQANVADTVFYFGGYYPTFQYNSRAADLQIARSAYWHPSVMINSRYKFTARERIWLYRGDAPYDMRLWTQAVDYLTGFATPIDQYTDPEGSAAVLFEYNDRPPPKQ